MDMKGYRSCMATGLKDKKLSKDERKLEFCTLSKLCSGKAKDRGEAESLCSLPKEPKPEHTTRKVSLKKGAGMRLVFLTSTGCKPCSAAKQQLQEHIHRGEIEMKNIQTDDWAADLAAKYKLYSVPKLLVVDNNNEIFGELPVSDTEETI